MKKNKAEQEQVRVAVYLRVSTEDQAEKYGIDLQKDSVMSSIKSKGKLEDGVEDAYILAGENYIYIDENISGSTKPSERPAFSRLQEDILNASQTQKPFDAVVVYKIDRFARKLKILLDIVDFFEENEIKFISANESIDTSTPFGKAILGILGIISELEIETTKQRTQDGRKQAMKKGVIMGGSAPYGYTKNPEKQPIILDAEAEVVKIIFDKFTRLKWSIQKIANYLSESKYLSPDASAVKLGKRKGTTKKKNSSYFWRAEKIKNILINEFYIGKQYYNKSKKGKRLDKIDWILSEYKHQPIIDVLTFEKAQDLVDDNRTTQINENRRGSSKHIYLLSGLLKCDSCKGKALRNDQYVTWVGSKKKTNKKISYSYKCGKKNKSKFDNPCTTIPIPADQLEEKIINLVQELIKNPTDVFKYQKELRSSQLEIGHIENSLKRYLDLFNSIENKIERLKEQHKENIIDISKLKSEINTCNNSKEKYQAEITKLEFQLSKKNLSKGYYESLEIFRKQYDGMLEDIKTDREKIFDIVHALISYITVYSRPVTESDVIAGKKRKHQQIPYEIEITMRLPKEMMKDLTHKFGVLSDVL